MKDKDGRSKEDIADSQAGEEVLEIPNPPPGVSEHMTGSGTTELTVEEQDVLAHLGMRSDPPKADAAQPIEFTHGLPPAEPASTTTQGEPASTQPNRGEPASDEDEGDNEAGQRVGFCQRLIKVLCGDGWNVIHHHGSGSCVIYGPYKNVGKMFLRGKVAAFYIYRGEQEFLVLDGIEQPTGLQPGDMEESALFKIEGTTDEAPIEEYPGALPAVAPPAEKSPDSDPNPPDCPGIQIHPLPQGKVMVIIDGEQSQVFDEVGAVSYDDAGRAYFAARQDVMWFVFHHPDVHGPFDEVWDLTFRKGKLSFLATDNDQLIAVNASLEPVPLPRMAKPPAAPVVKLVKPALVVTPPAEPVPPAPPIAVTHAGEAAPASGRPSADYTLDRLVARGQPAAPASGKPDANEPASEPIGAAQPLFVPLPPPSGKKGKGIIRRVASKVWKAVSRPAPASGKKLKVKRATPKKAQPFFKAFLASCALILVAVIAVSISMWFWKPSQESPETQADQSPVTAPVRTGVVPAAPTAQLLACEREERDVSTASLSLVARASKGTKWQATGDAKCFQIDLAAWSTVSLGRGPGKVQAIVDCTKSKRSNATDRQRDGRPCWDVTDCVVASCRDWP